MLCRLKEKRRERGLSQVQLARALGVRIATISDIENGKQVPYVDLALQIAAQCGCLVEDIWILHDQKPTSEAR